MTVIPCPTKDPIIDDQGIRKALFSLMQKSGPDLDPGAGIPPGDSVGLKRERAGDIYRKLDGTYYFVEDTLLFSTECFGIRAPTSRHEASDTLVAEVHTHPTSAYLSIYGCRPVNGTLSKRWPGDSSRVNRGKEPDRSNGGGSDFDWARALSTDGVDQYVLNADGEVWRLSHNTPVNQTTRNTRLGRWSGNAPRYSCDWRNIQ